MASISPELLSEVAHFFSYNIKLRADAISPTYIEHINQCCEPFEFDFLLTMVNDLKSLYDLGMSNKDICIAIIYTYYALTLGEQPNDLVDPTIYRGYADNPSAVYNLHLHIATSDEDLFRAIRRHMLFGLEGPRMHNGGRRRRRRRIITKNKSTRNSRRNKKSKSKSKYTKSRK